MEKTLVLLKPDAVQRGLLGEILQRIERKGLKPIGLKMIRLSDELLRQHYSHLVDEPFYGEIVEFMTRAPVVAVCVEGLDCVDTLRTLCGPTLARKAPPGTIRGDFAMSVQANLIHASDSIESAKDEIRRFFAPEELFTYERNMDSFTYSVGELSNL